MDFSRLTESLGTSPLTAIPLLFVAGLLTSLTPCVYPMIPITVALVGQESMGANRNRWRPLFLTLSYVVGVALVYAILGVIAGMTGSIFGSISSNPWLYFLQANVLMLAGLFMLDVFTFTLPASTMEWASRVGSGGNYGGAFAMGSVSGLVAAPCGAPVMAAVLTWVTRTQSAVLGFITCSFSPSACVPCWWPWGYLQGAPLGSPAPASGWPGSRRSLDSLCSAWLSTT